MNKKNIKQKSNQGKLIASTQILEDVSELSNCVIIDIQIINTV